VSDKHLTDGIATLSDVQDILQDKFSFAEIVLHTDKTKGLTTDEFEALCNLGWRPDGPTTWEYRG